MKKLWALALIGLLAPVVGKAQVQSFTRGSEIITVEKLWSKNGLCCVAVDEQSRIFIGGGPFDDAPKIRVSSDGGKTWTPDGPPGPYGMIFAFANIDSGYMLAGTDDGIYRSKDHGVSWQQVFQIYINSFFALLVSTKDRAIFAGAADAIYYSTDNGNSWSVSADSAVIYPYVDAMVQLPDSSILAGMAGGLPNLSRGIVKSTDNGKTWVNVTNGLPHKNIYGLTAYPSGFSQKVYAMTGGGAYVSEYGGNDGWKHVDGARDYQGTAAFTCSPLGTFLGFWNWSDLDSSLLGYSLYRSYGADGWLPIPGVYGCVTAMAQWSAYQILVATPAGLYLVSFYNPTKVEDQSVPTQYSLSQNYPNPFNPTTTIKFSVPKSSPVTLEIYNILGEKVRTLINGENFEPGYWAVNWDGKDNTGLSIPSGVYFYRLVAGEFVKTMKMISLK